MPLTKRRGASRRRMMVAAASGSVGETIAPRTKAASQGRPGMSACAAQATAHIVASTSPTHAERERTQVGPEVAEVREDRRGVEKRRQEDDQHDFGQRWILLAEILFSRR